MFAHTLSTPVLAFTSSASYAPKHGGSNAPQPVSPEEDGEPGGRRHRWRGPVVALLVVAALLGVGYAAGVKIFASHYYPGTTVMGADISLLTSEEAAALIEDAVGAYSLTVSGDDFSWTYTASSASEVVDAAALAEELLSQNDSESWPVHLVESMTGQMVYLELFADATADDLAADFDREGFAESLTAAVEEYNAERTGVFDPASAYDEEAGAFTLEQARANELLDVDAILEDALTAVAQLKSEFEIDESYHIALADGATDAEIQAVCDAANALLGASLTFTLGSTEVATLSSDQLFSWINFTEEFEVSLDTDALTAWATELAESCNTVDTERTYTREDGEEVTVSGGTWGWEVDVDSFVETVQEAVAEGQTGTIEIPTTSEADTFTVQGERDWGAYIDVDISEQWARYYDADGNLVWESGVITSNTTKGYITPEGVYYINAKYKNITLRGPYDSETGTYEWESRVSYWMAFKGTSYGFHDATWQNEDYFGVPGANTWTGSHGCVNLPLDAAEELYDLVYIGLCVVVHE